ncbi:hypothetical protein AV530_009590 [Patagioenas fasciata monilis]|uniref:Uncharacterized protein n=1 Tax=Patagioenas fasciata monilis TaxID=372326 RepID=A0A1V4KN96_PATFA|nr:hypothetical protein AV530_009590 [Patagioenas fasciata monilis]
MELLSSQSLSSSVFSLLWTNTSTRFLLFQSVRGHGQIFEVLYKITPVYHCLAPKPVRVAQGEELGC